VVDRTYLKTYQSEKRPLELLRGFGYMDFYYADKYLDRTADFVEVLKSPKKIMKKAEVPKIELSGEYVYETGKRHYSPNEYKVNITLL